MLGLGKDQKIRARLKLTKNKAIKSSGLKEQKKIKFKSLNL